MLLLRTLFILGSCRVAAAVRLSSKRLLAGPPRIHSHMEISTTHNKTILSSGTCAVTGPVYPPLASLSSGKNDNMVRNALFKGEGTGSERPCRHFYSDSEKLLKGSSQEAPQVKLDWLPSLVELRARFQFPTIINEISRHWTANTRLRFSQSDLRKRRSSAG